MSLGGLFFSERWVYYRLYRESVNIKRIYEA